MNIKRQVKPLIKYGYFLFGPRGAGKTTMVEELYPDYQTYKINLLTAEQEELFRKNPDELIAIVKALDPKITHVIIDEIQKIPKLLDAIHFLLENEKSKKIFVITGSSSRKIKLAGGNMLAGRVFNYTLLPFSFEELESSGSFNLNDSLKWGMLPKIFSFTEDEEKIMFLKSYCFSYIKAEVWQEQFIRKLEPFQRFLEVMAQSNGEEVNFSRYSTQVGVDDKTIKTYFSILEDTFLGIFLYPFRSSIRKQLSLSPKFYLIDIGIMRALSNKLQLPVSPKTSDYGKLFEQFCILECYKIINNKQNDYKMNFLRTKSGLEVDLVLTSPKGKLIFIEIKSTEHVEEYHTKTLAEFIEDQKEYNIEFFLLSQDPIQKIYHDRIRCLHWKEGFKAIFG